MKELVNKTNDKIIPAHQDLATKRWYEGASSPQIAKEILETYNIKVADSTIRWWFCDEGTLVDYYEEYALQQDKLRSRQAKHTFKANVDKAIGTLAMVMAGKKGFGAAQVMASKEWLERSEGKVVEKTENINMNISFSDWIKEDILKEQQENEHSNKDTQETISK